ncbi:MAG: DNA translocase FtsK 4TM domain-containing protein, partial [Candidatus Omnitrophota bacterium]
MKKDLLNEIQGIIVLAIGLILLASLISFIPDDLPWFSSQPHRPVRNLVGVVGAYSAGALFFAFGYSAYCLIIFLFFWSWNKFSQQELDFTFSKLFIALVLFCVISALLSMAGEGASVARFERGGMIGFVTSDYLVRYLSPTGAYIILLTLGAMTLVLTGEFLVSPLLFKLMDGC